MSLGTIFCVIALIIFFLGGIGIMPTLFGIVWGLFALTLGIMLSGVAIPTGVPR